MLEALKLRTLVIGNSGSGKSSLAEGLGALIHAPIFDLDLVHWKDDGYGAKQDEDVARQQVANLAATKRWDHRSRGPKGAVDEVANHDSIADRNATQCMKKVLSLPEAQNVNYLPRLETTRACHQRETILGG
jgi:ATP-dependent protease HslVU (ClpYQ) ATPase subunit